MAARALSFVLYYSGGLWVFERVSRKGNSDYKCTVVNYHRVACESPGYHDVAVDPANFRSQVEYMVGRGYRFLSLSQFHDYLEGRFALEGDSILLTFDDGYRDNYSAAFPILQEFGIPAAIFLCTGSIQTTTLLWWDRVAGVVQSLRRDSILSTGPNADVPKHVFGILQHSLQGSDERASAAISSMIDWLKDQPAERRDEIISAMERNAPEPIGQDLMLTWDMVREMRDAGFGFGAHSVTHPVFSDITSEHARDEILESKRCIEEQLGDEVTAFAYPYGKWGYFDASTADVLRDAGIKWAYTTENGINAPGSDPYTLRRNGLRDTPRYLLAVRLAGVFEHPALASLRARLEGRRPSREHEQS